MRHGLNQRNHPRLEGSPSESERYPAHDSDALRLEETFQAAAKVLAELPASENAEGAVEQMLRANAILRHLPWP